MTSVDVVVIGSYVQDHCWTTKQFPQPGESRIGAFSTGPGGKGFNQAIACHRQGVSTCFLGAIGRDRLGETAQAFARNDGLRAEWELRDDAPTAASSIVVNARGENLIVVALGANEKLSPEFVSARAPLIAGAKVVLCQLENGLEATREALTIARRGGAITVLNPAPINEALTRDLIALADVITPNETEFAFLIERLTGDRDAATAALAAPTLALPQLHELCRRTGVPHVVVTLGAGGCFVSHAPASVPEGGDDCYRLQAEPVSTVDTTGAGDAFSGGLAAGLVLYEGLRGFRRAVQHANRVAAISTETPGTAPAMPSRAVVEARYAG